jgi:hypothetical protein
MPVCLGAAVTNFGSGTRSRGLRERSAGAATTDPLPNYYRTTTESLSRQLTRYYYGDHEFGAVGG